MIHRIFRMGRKRIQADTAVTTNSPASDAASRVFQRASSLVTTLLVLVVLSTIVVAFMQSMSVERSVARSAKNKLQSQEAAQAGLSAATSQMLLAIGTNQAFVTGQTNFAPGYGPLTTIGKGDLTNLTQIMPLASGIRDFYSYGASGWTNQLAQLYQALTNASSVDVNTSEKFIQNSTSRTLFRASWVYLTNSDGTTNARYAYIILDEQARLNPLIHTGTGFRANATNWYGGPGDIQLTNSASPILTPSEATAFASHSSVSMSPDTLAQAFVIRTNYENVKHMLTANINYTYDVLPMSMTNGGQPKYNINKLATNPASYTPSFTNAAEVIGGLIMTNLPAFSSRDPSLRGNAASQLSYLNRLAANIVDYIDTDSVPTFVNGGEPAGRDRFPLVTAVLERFRLVELSKTTDPATATIESQCFVQVWNPYSTDATLQNPRFVLKNRMKIHFANALVTPFAPYDKTLSQTITVRPNEFVVLEFPVTADTWSSPGTPPTSDNPDWITSPDGTEDGKTHSYFQLFSSGLLIDMNRRPPVSPENAVSGLPHGAVAFNSVGLASMQSDFIPTYSSSPNWRFVGDPRATFMSSYDWGSVGNTSYTSTRWKGRQQATPPRYQEFSTNWVNRDYMRTNPAMGNAPASTSITPSQVAPVYDINVDGVTSMAYIRNGPMTSIAELGHVFDPIQAADDLTAPLGGTDTFGNRTPFVAGGGRTLRIGQPEFTVSNTNSWNTNGRRAIELLDLFTINSTNADSMGYPVAVGRINPNTAPPEVVAAVLSGIKLTSDAGIASASLINIGSIATNIVTNRPYSRLSDLYKAMQGFATATNYSPAFSSSVGGGTTNLAAFDRVREEAFGKLIQHLAVQSRTYRVYTIGEALDSKGKTRGQSVLESLVYFQPVSTNSSRPLIQFQKYLK